MQPYKDQGASSGITFIRQLPQKLVGGTTYVYDTERLSFRTKQGTNANKMMAFQPQRVTY